MFIFSGSSNLPLTQKIAETKGLQLGESTIKTFANGEKSIKIISDVFGQDVFILQSFSQPVNDHIMEFLLMVDALERAGAEKVTAIIPWMGYSLQDKVFTSGEPIAARVVADVVSNSYVQRVILLDLHSAGITGLFSVPTVHVRALDLFAEQIKQQVNISESVVVSPDFGGIKQARILADKLGLDLSNVDKHRDLETGDVTPMGVSGNIQDKICIVYDDVVNTGGTVIEVSRFLKEKGAKEVHFCVSHGLFANSGLSKMDDPAINSIIITDSVFHESLPEKVKVISVANVIAQVLR